MTTAMPLEAEIKEALRVAKFLEQSSSSRELSIVITKLEEALLWLSKVKAE